MEGAGNVAFIILVRVTVVLSSVCPCVNLTLPSRVENSAQNHATGSVVPTLKQRTPFLISLKARFNEFMNSWIFERQPVPGIVLGSGRTPGTRNIVCVCVCGAGAGFGLVWRSFMLSYA